MLQLAAGFYMYLKMNDKQNNEEAIITAAVTSVTVSVSVTRSEGKWVNFIFSTN